MTVMTMTRRLHSSSAVAVTMTVTVLVEEQEADEVDHQTSDANVEHPVLVLDGVCFRQSFDRFEKNSEAQRNEKDRVDQRTHHLGPSPAVGVLV